MPNRGLRFYFDPSYAPVTKIVASKETSAKPRIASLCHHYHEIPPQLYQFVLGTVSPRVEKVKVHPLAADRLESLPTSSK